MVGNMFFILMEEREDSAGTVGPRQSICLSPTESVCECEFVKFSLFKWQSYGIDSTICKDLKNVLNRGLPYKESFIQNFSSFEDM